ncbi:hypothetical protein Xcel_1640 [Xylanimonas cellulosilytica DSM 15894]|uniref:Uncharacterized protein n=1 Tax=Xylanimonas cellulosilytica (strain DSM 15894 / JCM 12276 / CECT 5975 / KCTC 9989 / LMG 20990 / NBRC 107835 / XIL07) TaxID=446471 RepID=D1BSH1_XYLCX|nr:hypothetical protein [Xylanimonas cellulosilytica]ACZ30663.1 hypothetical protein Xcel_1640 [Xylanimonas cellulosilytica DSM 15894]
MSRPPATSAPRRPRTDRMTTVWLVAAVVTAALAVGARDVLPQALWTTIHVVTLGVLTNAILQWSWYFARALLHLPADDPRSGRDAVRRSVAFNLALVGLVASMWTAAVWGTVVFAGAVGAVIGWHGFAMLRAARGRFASRFAVVVRFYVTASAFLVLGCVLAGFLTVAMFDAGAPGWLLAARDDLTLAHAVVNVGGWVGLSIAGTIVTLGPTMLRTKLAPDAVARSLRALPVLAGGIGVAGLAASLGWLPGVGIGLLAFAAGLADGVAVPLVRAARAAGVRGYAPWTMASGLGWTVLCLVAVAVNAFGAADGAALRVADLPWLALLGAGGVGQVFIGALSYLMPVVIGGGPAVMRRGMAVLETAAPTRVALRNAAVALLALTTVTGSELRPVLWGLVVACFAADVVLFARSGATQGRARRERLAALGPETPGPAASGLMPARLTTTAPAASTVPTASTAPTGPTAPSDDSTTPEPPRD